MGDIMLNSSDTGRTPLGGQGDAAKVVAPGQLYGAPAPFRVAWSASAHRVTKLFPSGALALTVTNATDKVLLVKFNANSSTEADNAFADSDYPETASAGLELSGPDYHVVPAGQPLTFPASPSDPILRVDMKPAASATGEAYGCGIIRQ